MSGSWDGWRDCQGAGGARILVIGVGNVLWADEGFGVRAAEAFAAVYETPETVSVVDGGTQGLYLVDFFREHGRVIIFDAVDFGDAPGALRLVRDDEIPAFVTVRKVSLHQAGLQDVIACAKLLGGCAAHMLLIGVQPVELEDYGGSLRPPVHAAVAKSIDIAAAQLRDWGVPVSRRDQGSASEEVTAAALALERYEAERPGANEACRIGDARVLAALADRLSVAD